MVSALDRLRAATDPLHRQLESLPYSRAVLDGSLSLAHYARFLRALHVLHSELEQALEQRGDSTLRTLLGHTQARRLLLDQDLAHLRVDPLEVDAASLHAMVLAQDMRLAVQDAPARMLGHAYVLEGSQLGGLVQRAALEKLPALQAGGLSYLAGAGAQTQAQFQQFVRGLEAALVSEVKVEQAIDGARASFAGFANILAALDDPADEVARLSGALNEEAGTHAVPDDLREVAAALRAGERSYREVPYYMARYGERGLRFTRSDSAWLVTLAREPDATQTLRHVHWLGRTLASRGMPRMLLEQHLELLHDALVQALPERAASYHPLKQAAMQLRDERQQALPQLAALLQSFPRGLAVEHTVPPESAAQLLLAAVADEKRGVARAVPSLTRWLLEPGRFSTPWIAAGEALLRSARVAS